MVTLVPSAAEEPEIVTEMPVADVWLDEAAPPVMDVVDVLCAINGQAVTGILPENAPVVALPQYSVSVPELMRKAEFGP